MRNNGQRTARIFFPLGTLALILLLAGGAVAWRSRQKAAGLPLQTPTQTGNGLLMPNASPTPWACELQPMVVATVLVLPLSPTSDCGAEPLATTVVPAALLPGLRDAANAVPATPMATSLPVTAITPALPALTATPAPPTVTSTRLIPTMAPIPTRPPAPDANIAPPEPELAGL